jgi:hypothetical protein
MQKATCPHEALRSSDFACPQNCEATSVEGYVGQDFGELSRVAVLVLESGRKEEEFSDRESLPGVKTLG